MATNISKRIIPVWVFKVAKKRLGFLSSFLIDRLRGRTFYETPDGIKLFFSTPYHRAMAISAYKGEIEPEMMAVWKEKAASAIRIYDIGGFNGIYGLTAAKENPQARVLIFEPDPVNVRHVNANIRLNNLDNCFLEPIALTDATGIRVLRWSLEAG